MFLAWSCFGVRTLLADSCPEDALPTSLLPNPLFLMEIAMNVSGHALPTRTVAAVLSAWLLLLLLAASAAAEPAREQIEFFEKKIRPVLVEHCYRCHSAQASKVRGGLLLDTREDLRKGGDRWP